MATVGDSFDLDYAEAADERRRREGLEARAAVAEIMADRLRASGLGGGSPTGQPAEPIPEQFRAPQQAPEERPDRRSNQTLTSLVTGEEPQRDLFGMSDVLINGLLGGIRDAAVNTADVLAPISPSAPFFRSIEFIAKQLGHEVDLSPGAVVPEVAEPETTVGRVSRPLAQFATAFIPAASALRAAGVGAKILAGRPALQSFAQGSLAGAASDALAFDPHEARLSNLAQDFGVENEIVDFLAADAGDSELLGRTKNVIEGLAIGGIAEPVIRGIVRGAQGIRSLAARRGAARASGDISEEGLASMEAAGREVMFAREHVGDIRRAQAALAKGEHLDPDLVARLDPLARATGRRFSRETLAPLVDEAEAFMHQAEVKYENIIRETDAPEETLAKLRQPVDEYVPPGVEVDAAAAKIGQDAALARPGRPVPEVLPAKDSVLFNRLKVTTNQVRGLREAIKAGDVAEQTDWLASTFDSTNFDRIAGEDGIKDILSHLSREFGRAKNTVRDATERPLLATAEAAERLVRADARELGTDEGTILRQLDELIPATADLDVKINAIRTFELALTKKVQELADITARGMGSNAEEAAFIRYATLLANVNDARAGVVTQVGRALSSLRIRAATSREMEQALQNLVNERGGRIAVRDLAVKLQGARGSRAATRRVLDEMVTPGGLLKRMFFEHYINGLLSSPVTTAVNALSNTAVGLWMPAERLIEGAFRGNRQMIQGAARMYLGMFHGLRAAFLGSAAGREVALQAGGRFLRGRFGEARRMLAESEEAPSMLRAFAIGDTITVPNSRQFDLLDANDAISSDNIRQLNAQRLRQGKALGVVARQFQRNDGFSRVFDAMGSMIRLPSRFLTSFDELAKSANYHAKVHQMAFDDAIKAGLDGADIDDHINTIVDQIGRSKRSPNLSPEMTRQLDLMDSRARKFAAKTTFTEELPFGSLSRTVQDAVLRHPTLRLVFPFIRTPANILKFAVRDRTPLALAFRESRQAIFNKEEGALARMVIGSTFGAMAAWWASEGRITGGGPTDPEERQALLQSGWKPYSIRVSFPDGSMQYVSYQRLDPMGMILGLGSDLAELSGRMENAQLEELTAGLVALVSRNLTSKSYFQSLEDMALLVHDPGRFLTQFGTRTAGAALVPGSNLWLQMKRVTDPTLPQVDRRDLRLQLGSSLANRLPEFLDDAWVELANKIGAAKAQLEEAPTLNIWGEKVTLPMGVGPDIMSPFFASTETQSPVRAEIARLKVPISMSAFRVFPAEGGGVRLSPKEINRYIELTAHPPRQKSLEERLLRLINSKKYQEQLSDGFVDPNGGVVQGGKAQLIVDEINAARSTARGLLRAENTGVRDRVAAREIQERFAKTVKGLEDLAQAGGPGTNIQTNQGAAQLLNNLRGNR